ncbi:unnamed protein product [Alternaria alternata]
MSRQRFRINNAFEWRTLRKSARHQIARDRAMRLWIYPWITAPTGRFKRHCPEASLLGLPTELRQNILYKAFDMMELSDMVKQPGKKGKKLAAQTKAVECELRQRREKSLGIRMSQFESDSITMLHRRIGDFCCVSLLIQTDMEYVGKLWKRDLDEQLEWQFQAPLRLLKDPAVGDKSDLSRRVEQVSNNMSERGETASNQSEQVLRERCDALQQQLNEEYDRSGSLEQKYDKLKDENTRYKNEFEKLKREREDTEYALKKSEETLVEEQSTIKALEARNVKLDQDLALKEAALKDKDNQNANLAADYQQLHAHYSDKLGELDDLRVKLLEKKLEFDDLRDQWSTDQKRIADLEEAIQEHEDSNLVAELENDIAGLHAIQEQDSRTIIVKDERISHLEGLLQKEQQRTLHHADEAARTAAASPVDDQRHIGSLGGTLEDEFSSLMLDESDFIDCEPSEYELEIQSLSAIHVAASVTPVAARVPESQIDISQAASVEPRNPAPAPPCSIVVNKAGSTEPVAVKTSVHAIAVSNAASVEPRDPMSAPLSTIDVSEAASTAPKAVRVPEQTTGFYTALSTEPIEPPRVQLFLCDVQDVVSFAPDQPAIAPLDYSPQNAASTEPIEPARVPLSVLDAHQIASFAPVQPASAPLDYTLQNVASTEPVEPARVPLSIVGVNHIASYAPDQPAGAPLDYSLQNATSTEPIEPARAHLSMVDVHDIASYAPKQPAGTLLRLREQTSVSTEPVEPARDTLAFDDVYDVASFAPKRPASVASTISRHEIANFAPKEPSHPLLTVDVAEASSTRPIARQITSAEFSTQTDAPATTNNFSTQTDALTTTDLAIQTDALVVATTESSAQTDVPALTRQLLAHTALATTPIEPSTQITTAKSNNHITPVMVTREIKPVEQTLPKPELERPNTTTEAQAHTNNDTAEERVIAKTSPVMATRAKKARFAGWIPILSTVLFAVWSLILQAELATWKNANGVGFGGGHGNVASRSGAHGNGRDLFGDIPIGMNIGNSWVSEQIAQRMSVAMSFLEDWVGIVNEPMY